MRFGDERPVRVKPQPPHLGAESCGLKHVSRVMLSKLFHFLNKDLTGRTWVVKRSHPYFGEMVYFGNKDASRAYWEISNLPLAGGDRSISVYANGTPSGPTGEEERFCREMIRDLGNLVAQCLPVVRAELEERQRKPLDAPINLFLESFAIPERGDRSQPWEATFSLSGIDGLFTVEFVKGRAIGARFDD